MAKRCPTCRKPTQMTYVDATLTGPDNVPVLYRNVRRYACVAGCRPFLEFEGALPADAEGARPIVLPEKKPAEREADFNDRLLLAGLAASMLLAIAAVWFIPMAAAAKAAVSAAIVLMAASIYRFLQTEVVLPSYFPVPAPYERPAPLTRPPVAIVAEAPAPPKAAKKKAAAEKELPAGPVEIPKLERKPGEPIKMKVILEGVEHELELNEGENMLDAALNRNVDVDYSCLEGLCDSCAVRVLAGLENLSEPTQEERDMLGDDVQAGMRLACQVKVNGPVVIQQ